MKSTAACAHLASGVRTTLLMPPARSLIDNLGAMDGRKLCREFRDDVWYRYTRDRIDVTYVLFDTISVALHGFQWLSTDGLNHSQKQSVNLSKHEKPATPRDPTPRDPLALGTLWAATKAALPSIRKLLTNRLSRLI